MQIEITSKELKKHIGKKARFLKQGQIHPFDNYQYGEIRELCGKNVWIGCDWYHFTDLKSIEVDYETKQPTL